MSSNQNNGGNAKAAGYAAAKAQGEAEQAKQTVLAQQQQNQSKAGPQGSGSSLGGNSQNVTFDKAGNTLVGGKITQFAGRQSREDYLAQRGLGNTGQVINQEAYAKASFSDLAPFSNATEEKLQQAKQIEGPPQPKSLSKDELSNLGKSGNAGQNKLALDSLYGSAKEDAKKASEADRASIFYNSKKDQNPDYVTGGKPDTGAVAWVAPIGNHYKNMGQGINNSLVRNSPKEDQVKQSEAERAFANLPKGSHARYGDDQVFLTGGKQFPVKNQNAGVETAKSKGKSYGYDWVNAKLGTTQLGRNTSQEEKAKAVASSKASVLAPSSVKTEYNPLVNLTDTRAEKTNQSVFRSTSKSKASPPLEEVVANRVGSLELGNGLVSLSNQQIESKNADIRTSNKKSESDLKSYFNQGQKEDATFVFYSGNKEVGQSSGPRTFHDFLSYQSKYPDLAIEKTYPSREKTLTEAVSKHTDFYSGLPQSYWDALSKSGYFSKNNAEKINNQLQLNNAVKRGGSLAETQGYLFASIHGGDIRTEKGIVNIGPQENEGVSFLKVPFIGRKAGSTEIVPETSFANVLQFWNAPWDLAAIGGIKLADKVGPKLIGGAKEIGSKAKTTIQERAMQNQYNFPKQTEKPTLEVPIPGRNQRTVRPSNMFREKLPSDILASDTGYGKVPVSARQNEPRNTMFEDTTKETIAKSTKIQNDLLTPATPKTNPPASTNIPFFPGRRDISGKLFTSNVSPIRESAPRQQNEEINLFGKTSSQAPVNVKSNPSESALSPISREYFGVKYKGIYPESYLPPSSAFTTSASTKSTIDIEPRGDYQDFRNKLSARKTASNAKFGFSITESKPIVNLEPNTKDYQDWKFSQFVKKSSKSEPSALDILGKTLPTKGERLQNYPQLPGKSEDVLGRNVVKGGAYSGKVPIDLYKTSIGHSDINVNAREFFGLAGEKVSKSSGKYSGNLPVDKFLTSAQGKREGDVAFFNKETGSVKREYLSPPEKTGRVGPLDIFSTKSESGKSIFPNAKGSKYYASEEVYPYGNSFPRGSLKTKDVGLAKFGKYQKEHPEQPSTGNPRIEAFFKNLPSRNTKSAVVTNNLFNDKGVKAGFRRTSKNLFEYKPIEKEPTGGTKSNTGSSKTETVLITRKPTRRTGLISDTRYDYEYEYKPVPQGKNESGLASGIMSGLKSGTLPKYVSKSGSKLGSRSILSDLNKSLELTKPRSRTGQQPKQLGRQFLGQEGKQTSLQMPRLLQTPKQGTTPKQTPKLTPKIPTPQKPRQSLMPKLIETPPRRSPYLPPKPPKRPPPVPLLGANKWDKRKSKSKSGPTGILNLNVNNIFSSSLSITVAKNRRVEF